MFRRVASFLAAASVLLASAFVAHAQTQPSAVTPPSLEKIVKAPIAALRRGPLLIHGNFCGIGNRPGTLPIDALDAACMHHDACTKTGSLPSCACDERLLRDAKAIAEDPRTPADLQTVAAATAAAMAVLVCEVKPTRAANPPAAPAPVATVPAAPVVTVPAAPVAIVPAR
jgi:hypothetical protein